MTEKRRSVRSLADAERAVQPLNQAINKRNDLWWRSILFNAETQGFERGYNAFGVLSVDGWCRRQRAAGKPHGDTDLVRKCFKVQCFLAHDRVSRLVIDGVEFTPARGHADD